MLILRPMKVHLVRLLLLCYITQGGTGGVSFANKNVSGLQKYLRFQNEYNKVEIELRVVQFWTEIKLVITNRTPASRSCDFVITRLISVQIALHSVQLPLLIMPMHPVKPLIRCNATQCTLISILLCFTPDDFTRQVEGAASQWVKWNIILIALNKGDFNTSQDFSWHLERCNRIHPISHVLYYLYNLIYMLLNIILFFPFKY